jgi:hypothetical protein
MEAHTETEPRFVREADTLRLAEAPSTQLVDAPPDASALLARLEHYVAESGRLLERVDSLEGRLRAERKTRRRLAEILRRERVAAKALADRAEHAEAAHTAAVAENEGLKDAVATSEQALQSAWSQIAGMEQQLAWARRPAWRKLLRRPPK